MLEAPAPDGVRRFVTELPKSLSLDGADPQTWVTVTKIGHFFDPRYGEFDITREMLLAMIANFDKRTYGQDIFLDVAHKPAHGSAAKFLKLELKDGKLRALLEWTPFGIDAVKNRGFRYLSADYTENYQDNEQRAQHGPLLFGAGLTIRPVIKGLDPVQLSEPDGTPATFLHPDLQSTLLEEITVMHKKLAEKLKALLAAIVTLSEPVRAQLLAAFEAAAQPLTDEAQVTTLMEAFADSGKKLAEQINAGGKDIKLSIEVPGLAGGLTKADVERILSESATKQADAAKKLAEDKAANVKLLSDTINAASGIDDATKKQLAESVADLITPEMSADQVKRLADNQIKHGNELAVARQLSARGFVLPAGNIHITLDPTNEVKALQEAADRRLGIASISESERFKSTGGKLQGKNKAYADKVLAEFDVMHAARLHAEHKMLAGGDGKVSDVAVPAIFERTVIREALYSLVGLQFVDVGTLPFSASALIPYSYRDTTAAGRSNTRVYEGGSIPRAGVKQTSETAYPTPQKIAFEVSDELRYLTGNGQLDWDALAENARNASRIIGEDTEQLIFDEQLNAADQYGAADVVNEAVATANGTFTIFKLAQFPVVRPKKIFDLQGNQVGNTLYPVTVKNNAATVVEYDGTNTQGAGTYFWMDYNLGEIHFVNQLGAPVAPANTNPIVASYSYSTNVYKFDTDQGAVATDLFWDSFLYRYGLRKGIIEDQRYFSANFGLMSGTVRTMVEQARSFIESGARNGTNLDADGNLGAVKGIPNFKSSAPGLAMGDQRIVIGQRAVSRFRMMKAWQMGQLQDQRDANGRFTGKKEAYGDQFIVLHTPTQLKAALTSIALFSTAARVNRVS
jgi:hypothetical protein